MDRNREKDMDDMNAIKTSTSDRICNIIRRFGEMKVSQLAAITRVSKYTVAEKANKLVDDGLLQKRKEGNTYIYSLKVKS